MRECDDCGDWMTPWTTIEGRRITRLCHACWQDAQDECEDEEECSDYPEDILYYRELATQERLDR